MSPRHSDDTDPPLEGEDAPRDCMAMRQVLDRMGERWTMVIVAVLSAGPLRFNQLRRTLRGISQRMLTLSLRNLERDGLVLRTVIPGVPAQVEYTLTALGRSFYGAVEGLLDWASAHGEALDAARAAYDARAVQAQPPRAF
jgi:DNA-binding HxlR family transcriptional regulator